MGAVKKVSIVLAIALAAMLPTVLAESLLCPSDGGDRHLWDPAARTRYRCRLCRRSLARPRCAVRDRLLYCRRARTQAWRPVPAGGAGEHRRHRLVRRHPRIAGIAGERPLSGDGDIGLRHHHPDTDQRDGPSSPTGRSASRYANRYFSATRSPARTITTSCWLRWC